MPKILIDTSQVYFWNKEWQTEEKEASQDIKEGKVKSFELVEGLLEELG
jgi:hypothetical protein